MNRIDLDTNPVQFERLLAAARQNAEQLAAIEDSGRATLPKRTLDTSASDAGSGDAGIGTASGSRPVSAPVSIPGYQMVCEIHRGGQGVVYQAIRESTGEDVAIKVLHDRRAASPRELERFEREAAVLRELNHSNLIAVSEVGVVDGRPFLVMPYISGWPLDEHVRRNGLSVHETLTLFLKVCDAVNVAHLNGVIHRDIKPSNIRVDDAGEPHVLDFGLAKTVTSSVGESLTETGRFVGSMPWASPEQADPSLGRVDVRTDVYSLGAVLYQLLTGMLPIDPIGSQREVLNRIVTAEPPSPRLLRPEINDEIDVIVGKCLSKDRARRYSNADGLAGDIRRYLAGEAIEAKRDSIAYIAKKLIGRHRGLVAAIGVVLLVGAVGGVASFVLWQKAAHESLRASRALDAESDQRGRAEAINTFLKEMLTAADPAKAKGAKFTVVEALDKAAARIDDGLFERQPLVEAEIRSTIGSTYLALGVFPEAESQLRAADVIQSRELGDEHRETLRTRTKLAETLWYKSDYAGVARIAEPTLETQRRVLGADDPDTLKSMVQLGRVLWVKPGRFFEAVSLLRGAIDGLERVRGHDHPETAAAMDWLGEAYSFNAYREKAESLHREALRINTLTLGEEHPATLYSMFYLAHTLDPRSAEAMHRRVYELRLRVLGPDHVDTLASQQSIAHSLNRQRRFAEAEPLLRESLAAHLKAAPDYVNTIHARHFLAWCLENLGKYEEAEILVRQGLDAARKQFGPEDPDTTIRMMCKLAQLLATVGKDAEAEQVAREVLPIQRRQSPRPSPQEFTQSSIALVKVLQRRGALQEAMQVERELIDLWLAEAHAPDADANTLNGAARRLLHAEISALCDPPKALELALQANERSGHQNVYHLRTLAFAYHQTGDNAKAIEIQRKAISLLHRDAPDRADFERQLHEFENVAKVQLEEDSR